MTTVRIPLESTIGAHGIPRQIYVSALRQGFSAEHKHDGGRFNRSHVIVVTGEHDRVLRFRRTVFNWVKQVERELS